MDTELLSDTFVELADTMVADFDVIDFLHLLTDRSVLLLAAGAAGVVLADPRGELRVAAASSEEAGLLELFQLQNDQGPCLECFRTGRAVTASDLASPDRPWPRFAEAATRAGFATVEAVARKKAYAYSQDRRLADVAGDIVARRLRLHRDQSQDGGP